jgi:hypothetical protein
MRSLVLPVRIATRSTGEANITRDKDRVWSMRHGRSEVFDEPVQRRLIAARLDIRQV